MPGRKSNISTTSVGPEDGAESTPVRAVKEGMGVEDLSLPKSMIARLAKGVLPANTQIHKDALLALHKSATVFVNFIASNSNENAHSSGKKTISPQDVIAALKDAEFEDFIPRLEGELKKYNDTQCDKRNTYRRKVKEEKAATTTTTTQDGDSEAPKDADGPETSTNDRTTNGHTAAEGDDERPAKRIKGDGVEGTGRGSGAWSNPDETDWELDEPNDSSSVGDFEIFDNEFDGFDSPRPDVTMADATEEVDRRGELRDEALDEPDSD